MNDDLVVRKLISAKVAPNESTARQMLCDVSALVMIQ